MAVSESQPPKIKPSELRAGWKVFVIAPLVVVLMGAVYIIRSGRTESVQEITYPQFLEKLKMGEIDRKAGVVLVAQPGSLEIIEGHLAGGPARKVRAIVDLQYDANLKSTLESQYGLVVTVRSENRASLLRFFSK